MFLLVLAFAVLFQSSFMQAPAYAAITVTPQPSPGNPAIGRPGPTKQSDAEQNTKDTNKDGQDKSNMLGAMAIAAGMAMIAAGVSMLPPPTTPAGQALIAAGTALVAAGMAALAAGKKAGENKNQAAGLEKNLSAVTSGPVNSNSPNPGSINIDPNLLRTGKADEIFSDLEKKTGINRDDFMKHLEAGTSVSTMLANAPKKVNMSEAGLEKLLSEAKPAHDAMDKMGVTMSDLDNIFAQGGGGGGNFKKPVDSGGTTSLEDLLAKKTDIQNSGGAERNGGLNTSQVASQEVQDALDKNGLTSKSLFEMVHVQYVKKQPMMFGVQKKIPSTSSDNPFANLESSGVDL